jgi:hypothetical protein
MTDSIRDASFTVPTGSRTSRRWKILLGVNGLLDAFLFG